MWQDPVNSFVFPHGAMNQRGLTLCSCQLLIQQAGEQQKTYSLLAVLPPPSSPHQYAPRSRSSHRTIFAPRLWAVFEICRHIRFILFAWGICFDFTYTNLSLEATSGHLEYVFTSTSSHLSHTRIAVVWLGLF